MGSVRTAARTLLLALVVAGCAQEGDARSEEIWVIDFETHREEVQRTVQDLDLDPLLLEVSTIDQLYVYYTGLDIDFEIGRTGAPGKSSICIREGDAARIGRGLLDIGNRSIDRDCGENAEGIPRGVFINRLAIRFTAQVDGMGFGRTERTNIFARMLSLVLAHEIGHGLGLEHSDGIMDAFPDFSIDVVLTFSPTQRAILEENLLF